jgi:hypothetical protein
MDQLDPDPDLDSDLDPDPDPQHCFKQFTGARKEPSRNRVVVVSAPPSYRALTELVPWKRLTGLLKSYKFGLCVIWNRCCGSGIV